MRRINTSFVIALFTLLLVSICSAQQTSSSESNRTDSGRNASPMASEPAVTGGGTTNFIPRWISPTVLGNSVIYQAGISSATGAMIGIGTTTPAARLDVNGGINTAKTYGIGGSSVVNIGSSADANLFLGVGAGGNNLAGSGTMNTFSGFDAGAANTTGIRNTFLGMNAGFKNTTADRNTFVGMVAGQANTTGRLNTFLGEGAGFVNTTGNENTFVGRVAGAANTGNQNVYLGVGAGGQFSPPYDAGSNNVAVGYEAGFNNQIGNQNLFLGNQAGQNNVSGSNDVYIANSGPVSGNESNTIRIGDPASQTAAYIAGIYNATSSGGVPVYINSNGQLGTSPSSLRFKEQVRDMGDSTNALMKLRPVTFLYKPEYDKGDRTLQYGLIAEEVAKVYPELVAYDNDGQPYSVRYQYITTMLLNEVQKQYHRAEAEAKVITAQEQKIDELEQRLSRLESLIPQTVAQK